MKLRLKGLLALKTIKVIDMNEDEKFVMEKIEYNIKKINNILSGLGDSWILLDHEFPDDPHEYSLEGLYRSCKKIENLVDDLKMEWDNSK
tara:strand:- start:3353 stop:3622 length:270 start_codon:yes stop_codon:yes gene_type:complete